MGQAERGRAIRPIFLTYPGPHYTGEDGNRNPIKGYNSHHRKMARPRCILAGLFHVKRLILLLVAVEVFRTTLTFLMLVGSI
jgi:hypothetical protein